MADKQQRNKTDQAKLQTHSRMPFEKYKKAYKDSEEVLSKIPFGKDHCKNKQGKIKYSWIEFIFLKRTEKGDLEPFDTNGMKIDYIENTSCHDAHGFAAYATARFLYPVIKNCECVEISFKPGTKYKVREIGYYGEVDFILKIPPADKFDFVPAESKKEVTPADSNKEPTPFKYPIVVNEIEKKKNREKNEKVSYENMKFKNVPDRVKTKVGLVTNVEVKYFWNGEFYHTDERLDDGTYKINVPDPDKRKITGGAVAVIGQVTGALNPNQLTSVTGETKYLLMYKPEVTSKNVNMAQGLSYRYNRGKTIMKEINLKRFVDDETLKRFRKKEKSMGAVLQKKFEGRKKRTIVNWVTGYRKKGKFYARLEAPPGDYLLTVAEDSNKHRIKWPLNHSETKNTREDK